MRCDWASCGKDATIWCGQWWHCTAHYRLHCEFQAEEQRRLAGDHRCDVVDVPVAPKKRGSRPITSHSPRAEYNRRWMAAKRAAQRAEKASA